MKVAVCVKLAVDEAELKVDQSGAPVLQGTPTKVSTFDKNAVEEAVRLKATAGGDVTVFTVGAADSKKAMKEALAMGCDRGVLVVPGPEDWDALSTAELLAGAIRRSGPYDLVLCSEGSSDVYTGLVPPMLAERLGLPYVGYARKLEVAGGKARAERALEDDVELVEAPLPLVASVVSEINEPRYPTLIQIMQASKKPVEEIQPGSSAAPRSGSSSLASMSAQQPKRKRVMIEGSPDEIAAKLLDALSAEGVLK